MRTIAFLALLAAWLSVGGCGAHDKVHDASAALAKDLRLYVDNVAPATTLTEAQRKKVDALGWKLVGTSQRLEEALR